VADDMPSFDKECAPKGALKSFPSSLSYEFLGPNSVYVVIANASLIASQVDSLLRIPRMHCKAITYTLNDVEGIYHSMCMHCILMEDDYKSSIERQGRLNPYVQDVVKKEILKLLKAGIIYLISDSKWVRSVHVVSKKRGMMIIKNENNELIPARTITGWRMSID